MFAYVCVVCLELNAQKLSIGSRGIFCAFFFVYKKSTWNTVAKST